MNRATNNYKNHHTDTFLWYILLYIIIKEYLCCIKMKNPLLIKIQIKDIWMKQNENSNQHAFFLFKIIN